MSRAARAQRIGRPGRPMLPPQSPKPKRWFRRFVALIALLAIGAALYVINATFQPFVSDDEQAGAVPVQIPKGADAGSIGELLEAKGVVDDARFFELNATVTLRRNKLITGNYVLRRNMTNGAAIEALMQGPKVRVVKTFNVGVPEGLSRREAAKVLAGSGIEGSYLKAPRSRGALPRARKLGLPSSRRTPEGFLFPATYELKAGATARDLVDRQLDAFRDNFDSINLKAAQRRNLSRYDVREDRLDDRARDAVGEGEAADRVGDLQPAAARRAARASTRRSATTRTTGAGRSRSPSSRSDTPYNTRINAGLPPTPIGNPGPRVAEGRRAPANTDYLFYVAKPGACHAFAETNAQHERNVAAYERAPRGERRQGSEAEVLTYLGVAGWPVAHSRSPPMHDAALAAAGLDDWHYLRLPLPPERFAETVRALPAAGFRGLNVTIPHKEAALALADAATPTAAAVGAANTLTFGPGGIHADNTDVPGLLEALRARPGGAQRARARRRRRRPRRGVRAGGADVAVWNRTRERAERLVADLGGRVVERPGRAEIVVNCTSVGLRPDDAAFKRLPLDADTFGVGSHVVDMVYRAGGTELLAEARRRGAQVVTGLEILVAQGAASFERWTGRTAPRAVMRAAVETP